MRSSLPPQLGGGGLCTARPHFSDACSPLSLAVNPAADEPTDTLSTPPRLSSLPPPIERHCHAIFEELRPKSSRDLSDYRWFLWGTALHPANQTTGRAEL
jgi:hypothetical protein